MTRAEAGASTGRAPRGPLASPPRRSAEPVTTIRFRLLVLLVLLPGAGRALSAQGAAGPRTGASATISAPGAGASLPLTPLQAATNALLDTLRPRLETAVRTSDWAAMDAVIARLREVTRSAPRVAAFQYDLGYALHRRASVLIVTDRAKEAKPLLEEAERALKTAVELGGIEGALALRGGVTGQLAGVGGALGAVRYGPRALRQLDEAVEQAPWDPRAALLNGITRLNAPRAVGGGVAKGEAELRRAIRLFESDNARTPQPTWGHADAWIWLAIALDKQDNPGLGLEALERALALAPGHDWIVKELRPKLEDRARTQPKPAG